MKICKKYCIKKICIKHLFAFLLLPLYKRKRAKGEIIHHKSILGKIYLVNSYCKKYL